MNPFFVKEEAIAIISIVLDVVFVDNKLDPSENKYVCILADKFNLGKQDVVFARSLTPNQVSATLSRMSYEKRKLATCFLMGAAMADGFSSRLECQIATMIIENCNLVECFNPQEILDSIKNWLES